MREGFAAIVLAGGAGRRLGGVDKAEIELGGARLLQRALHAVRAADPIIAVGPRRSTSAHVFWTREEPVGAGPVAGLAAGAAELPGGTELVAVLAVDHPFVTAATLVRLASALGEDPTVPGALLVDEREHVQWLVGVWRISALARVLPGPAEACGRSLRAVLAPLRPALVPAEGPEAADVDTPEDLERLRSLL